MNTERLRQIERVYHAALERPESERLAFLAEACAGRDDLRREVESLLAYQTRSGSFMESPAAADPSLTHVVEALRKAHAQSEPGRLAGTVLGAYELKALVALGGMGEVYRARDRRLGRTVAVKILSPHFAADQERRERFTREARIVSALNHPNICALYDVGEQDGVMYLVMEHLEGETLEQRLRHGALPTARAVHVLIHIAQALDAAHRRGVVHRDLKPGNVMLTRDGVKLLDFGIAAYAAPPGGADAANAAAMDAEPLTAAGRIVGTSAYMAPEQLHGQRPDARTDIFAFGALAYEVLTGTRAFSGQSPAEIIGAVLRDEPATFAARGESVPIVLERVLMRCLAKDPAERWQSMNDLLFALRAWQRVPDPESPPAGSPRRRLPWSERAVWAAIAAAALIAAIAATANRGETENHAAQAPVRFSLAPADGVHLFGSDIPFAISPDGRQIVYAGTAVDGTRQLWHRSLLTGENRALPGSLGATTPFWSADSEWVGFFAGNSLSKVRVSSGVVQVVAGNVTTIGGAAWSAAGDIVFPQHPGGLTHVGAAGHIERVPLEQGSQLYPQFLPDGRHFIYASGRTSEIRLASLDGGSPRTLLSFPVRVSSIAYASGTIFYVEDGTLLGRPFDEKRLDFSGEAVRIVDGIPLTTPARTPFSVSETGVLAYWTQPVGTPAALRWRSRGGQAGDTLAPPAQYRGFALSPDGRQLLLARIGTSGSADLWLREVASDSETQLTFDGAAFAPQWSPDGRRVAFSGYADRPPPNLFIKDLSTRAAPVQAGRVPTPEFASSWSGDGRTIITVRTQDEANRHDLWIRRDPAGTAERLPFNTVSYEFQGRLSPDGNWLAFVSDQNGKDEVWVARMPDGTDRQRVSPGGATMPQ